jgi:hypothetical protein
VISLGVVSKRDVQKTAGGAAKAAPTRSAATSPTVRSAVAPVTSLDPEFVKLRLRGKNPLVAHNRRLMSVTPATYKRLQVAAKKLSDAVGFVVFPLQVAALIVERWESK